MKENAPNLKIAFLSKEGSGILSRYDGISVSYSILPVNNGDGFNNASSISLRITFPNKDTGYSESYTPIGGKIKSYFNCWKVKNADANDKLNAWASLEDGQDAIIQTLAYVRANRAAGYTPYKLTYQLITPKIKNIQVEGDFAVNEWTKVTVDSGSVVREKASLKKFNKEFYINRGDNNATFLPS
ncbi:hypothetical protein [Bacillus toyonensis]|uniref:hypothetical protein n=1 Tax=Bacillus toyonensis TaxID=155322 RepID=UPI0032F626C9|nr:hypothetical protein [Bacillus toyonensis]